MAEVSRIFYNPFQAFGMQDGNKESVKEPLEPKRHTIRKKGFVTRKRKDMVSVDVDGEIKHFSLENVDMLFSPEMYDRITLICDADDDSSLISKVLRIEYPNTEKITGKVTSVEPGMHGVIDDKYFFNWNALPSDQAVNKNDRVTADCIECETANVAENVLSWRCVRVTVIDQSTGNPSVTSQNKNCINRNGIEITEYVGVEFNDINETKDVMMMVRNTTSDNNVEVIESCFVGNRKDSQLMLVSPSRKASFLLKPGDVKEYKFRATSKYFGSACEEFAITFTGETTGCFKISRFINLSVHDTERKHRTIGTGSNVRNNYKYTHSVCSTRDQLAIYSGEPPVSAPNFIAKRFNSWYIPSHLRDIVLTIASSRCSIFDALATVCPHLNDVLTMNNYCQVFHDLLHLEECEMEHNIRKYDMKSYFTREKEYLALAVQDVGESRPSIVIGDYIIATDPWAKDKDKEIGRRGWIHDVKQHQIFVKFDEIFHKKYNNEDYTLTFHFSRRSLRIQHHAIELASKRLPLILFPDEIQAIDKQVDVTLNLNNGQLQCDGAILPWFNPSLNIVQKEAVTNILQGVARPIPYIIFGPPGTGKTVTLIETVLQILKNLPNSRILVATPSNSAANLITERIIKSEVVKHDQFLRLVSHNNFNRDAIPKAIIRHCGTIDTARDGTTKGDFKVNESGLQMNCNATRLKTYRMLIGTCITLGKLMECDFPKDHFTHVIIDESGQSLETELIIPLTFVDKDIGQVILAGDPMQLGPIVLSRFAKKLGLGQSALVRLLDRSLYKPDAEKFEHRYDPRLVTRLVYNYRSLPSIMSVYNDMFYDKDLKAMVNDVDSAEAKVLRKLARILPNIQDRDATNGVIFVGVKGKNERCSESPSWYNNEEAESVTRFFKKLMVLGQNKDDVGIITPYTQQVKAIRAKIKKADLLEPKIGTVEEFQGQERQIILLSTVRTVQRQLRMDQKYSLGFIDHPNRMNVAISRARALLVIFGCPKLLSLDENWNGLIEHCKKNKSYVPCHAGDGDD